MEGKTVNAHRFAFEIEGGPIPVGIVVDHICHNPSCVRPDHLRLATHKQNLEHRKGATVASRTGIRNVTYVEGMGRPWRVYVAHNGKSRWVGAYGTKEDATAAAMRARSSLFTHDDHDIGATQE